MQNLTLYLGIGLLVFILYRRFSVSLNKNVKNLSAAEAYELIKANKDILILDVRTKQEYKSGHINGSKSIPVGELASRVNELEKYKDTPIIVHCASGGRSPSAVRTLLKNKFTNVYHMNHGLAGWKYGLK